MLVEEELEGVGDEHEVEDEVFVLGLVVGVADDVAHLLRILGDQLVPDVPVCLPDHVREENGLYLVHQENFGHCFQHFVHRIPEGDVAAAGHRTQDRYDPAYFVATVGVEGFAVARGDVGDFLLLLYHVSQ